MGAFLALFKKKEPKTPVAGILPRLKNLISVHYRGLIGGTVPFIVLLLVLDRSKHWTLVLCMWFWMAWFFLWQPVNVPVTGLIPIFTLPMFGAMSTDATCGSYMNEGIVLYIVSNMLLLLWNNSGLDRRLILWFLCSGDTRQFKAQKMVLKCCAGGFFLSMFCNRLIVCSIMTQYVTTICNNLQTATSRTNDPDFNEIRYILNSAIQTSCSIGSIAIIHSSFGTLAFRAIFYQTALPTKDWHDIFNYLEYSSFAFPLALVMLIVNIMYHMVLMNINADEPMSSASLTMSRNAFLAKKKEIPSKVTLHEKLTFFFSIVSLATFFFRWNKYMEGWSSFKVFNNVPLVRDATVAVTFVILLHSLPSGLKFLKFFSAKKKSQLGAVKPESGILWWRFVDKNVNYGYFFVIGSGVALCSATHHTKLDVEIRNSVIGTTFLEQDLMTYLLLVTIVGVLCSNFMSSVAAVSVLMPFIMSMRKDTVASLAENLIMVASRRQEPPPEEGEGGAAASTLGTFQKQYLGALVIGVASNLGFMAPFLYTPAYFSHHTGKVPKKKVASYGVGSVIFCTVVLWVFVAFYAPILWDNSSIDQELLPTTTAKPTTPAEAAPPPALRVDEFADLNSSTGIF